MSKNFITLLVHLQASEPVALHFPKNGELNVDIHGFEPSYYAPPHILVIPVFLELVFVCLFFF